MAYNLPPPWSPGYALPDYVRVEGLQRRAFVTAQTPRGTYDAAKVGRAGYAVPGYVMSEGTGQGAAVTKWMPRGTVPVDPRYLEHPSAQLVASTRASGGGTQYEIAGGHPNAAAGAAIHTYGAKVATHLMRSIKQVPPVHRRAAMKRLFDKIDPKLWTRVRATASKAARAGMPPARALHHAIATEFHGGFHRELRAAGVAGKVALRSQLGLGCFGCAAIGLGDDPVTAAGGHWERQRAGQPAGECAGYVWVGGPGQVAPACPPGAKDNRTHAAGDANRTDLPTGSKVTALPPCGTKNAQGALIAPCDAKRTAGFTTFSEGPFQFAGYGDHRNRWTDPKQLTPDQVAWLASKIEPHMTGGAGSASNDDFNPFHYWFGYSSYAVDSDYYSGDETHVPSKALVEKTDPKQGQVGLFLYIRGKDPHADAYGAALPILALGWAPIGKSAWQNAVDTVGGWVSGAADTIGTIACNAVNQPGAAQAAMADPRAAAGVVVAQGLCAKPGAGGAAKPGAPSGPIVLPPAGAGHGMSGAGKLVLLGGGLAAAYLLTR